VAETSVACEPVTDTGVPAVGGDSFTTRPPIVVESATKTLPAASTATPCGASTKPEPKFPTDLSVPNLVTALWPPAVT
jgi:hypothetical protein